MVNVRLDPALVAAAKEVARLSGDTLTGLVAAALRAEIQKRRAGLRDRVLADVDRLELPAE
jgi:hypothetical protein